MPYGFGTLILSSGTLTADQIDAVFHTRNPVAPALGAIIVAEAHLSGINQDFLTAQIGDETAWWKSAFARERNNPAGIGAIDSAPGDAITFGSIREGIHAQCAHWLSYIQGNANPFAADDPRFAIMKTVPSFGTVRTIGQIGGGVWASAPDYKTTILKIMNEIAPAPGTGGTMAANPTQADLGFPGQIGPNATFFGSARSLSDVQWFVIHDTEGPTLQGAVSTFANPNAQGSAHIIIDKDGSWAYVVPITTVAFAVGNLPVNRASINVELVGFVDAHDGGYTDAQYRCAAAFFNFCVRQGMTRVPATFIGKVDADNGPLPDKPGIIGHMDVPDGSGGWGGVDHHTDPGPTFDFNRLVADIANTPVPISNGHTFPETGKTITGNIRGYWERFHDDAVSVEVFGLPVSDLLLPGNGKPKVDVPTQYFERAVLEDHSGHVIGRRIGAEDAKADGLTGPGI